MRFYFSIITSLIVTVGLIQTPAGAQVNSPERSPQRINKFIERMEKGDAAFGVFSSNVSVRGGANIASSGLDFVIIDLEHSPYDVTRLEGYLLGMISKRIVLENGLQAPTVPLVRVPAAGREQLQFVIKQVLDLGAMGIVVPHVDTAEDALLAVQSSRFPQLTGVPDFQPEGKRGVGYGWAARYWGLSGTDYARRADLWPLDPQGELVLWIMIETKLAVENIKEIAATPGIGGLFIGPSDLAFSLGVPLGDPAVETAIDKVVEAAKQTSVPLGTLCGSGQVEKRLAQGFHFLAVGSDAGLSGAVKDGVSIGRSFKTD